MARDPYRRHIRRMRRQMRKDGNPYGMIMIGPDEPFAYLILAALARWAYRHRSAFAPFTLALIAFIGASVAHLEHPGWWAPMTIVSTVLAILLGFPHSTLRRIRGGSVIARILSLAWAMCGIGRAAERVYAATVVAALGGWLSAATARGPISAPLPVVLVAATIVLGIPW